MTRRSKIISTLGPASRSPETVAALIEAGVDIFRINLAHHNADDDAQTVANVRKAALDAGRIVPILMDLPGPKLRTGPVERELDLQIGHRLVLSAEPILGTLDAVSTTLPDLAKNVTVGDVIYLADGEIVLNVTEIAGRDVVTTVVRGGILRSRKGLHCPAAELHVNPFTDEDRVGLEFALEQGAEYLGLSFVRTGDDVERVREMTSGSTNPPALVAKIETAGAVRALASIIDEANAVMVARGDLGIQTPLPELPALQKKIISACRRAAIPVITATQMLESMTRAPLPTRAEVSDVANAVVDGTDALMLSEETAVGQNPVEAVRYMADIASAADELRKSRPRGAEDVRPHGDALTWAVGRAAVQLAEEIGAAAILCPTQTGHTARSIAAFRPSVPVLGFSPRPRTAGRLAIVWGVQPMPPEPDGRSPSMQDMVKAARHAGVARDGQPVVIVGGPPGNHPGGTNTLRVVRV